MLDHITPGILIFAGITAFYVRLVIPDIPREIPLHRNHSQQDSIH